MTREQAIADRIAALTSEIPSTEGDADLMAEAERLRTEIAERTAQLRAIMGERAGYFGEQGLLRRRQQQRAELADLIDVARTDLLVRGTDGSLYVVVQNGRKRCALRRHVTGAHASVYTTSAGELRRLAAAVHPEDHALLRILQPRSPNATP